jgi:hypothetical protein
MKPACNPLHFSQQRDAHMTLARSFRRVQLTAFVIASVNTARQYNRKLVQLRRSLKEYQ